MLNRPEVIKARIAGASAATPPRLVPPPVVGARLVEGRRRRRPTRDGAGAMRRARSAVYKDGQLIGERSMTGPQFAGEIALPPTGNARWVTALATDKGGLVSAPQMLPLKPGPGTEPPPRRAGRRRHLRGGTAQADVCQVRCPRLAKALKASIGRYYGAESLQLLLDRRRLQRHRRSAREGRGDSGAPRHHRLLVRRSWCERRDGHYYLTPAGYNSEDPKGPASPGRRLPPFSVVPRRAWS